MSKLSNILRKIFPRPLEVPSDVVTGTQPPTKEELETLKRLGVSTTAMQDLIFRHTLINFERLALYKELDRAILYPLIGAAAELYSDVATTYSPLQNATAWVTSDISSYQSELSKLLELVGLEEKVLDWAYTLVTYGNIFIKVKAVPGIGIVSIDDDIHPINISRIDYNGTLVGFFETPAGYTTESRKLIAPWEYVHFRILGARKRRPLYKDPMYSEFRTVNLISPDTKTVSGHYGVSLLTNSLPVFKRLRLAEDSIMLARMSKGIKRYIFKVKVDSSNVDAASEIISQYAGLLKRTKALDVDPNKPYYDDKYLPMSMVEDVILPVWGDVNDLQFDELGGDVDIKFIVDVEDLRNQLSCALRVPLQLLGGYTSELPSSLGQSAIERLDIRFARNARRVQRALITGMKRLCQIHLSYLNLDPNPKLFDVHMSETSSAEEEELKDALDKGVDIADKFADLVNKLLGDNISNVELMSYINKRILKLNDFEIVKFMNKVKLPEESKNAIVRSRLNEVKNSAAKSSSISENTDLGAFVTKDDMKLWESKYGNTKVGFTKSTNNVEL